MNWYEDDMRWYIWSVENIMSELSISDSCCWWSGFPMLLKAPHLCDQLNSLCPECSWLFQWPSLCWIIPACPTECPDHLLSLIVDDYWQYCSLHRVYGFPGCSVVESPPANAGDRRDLGLIPGWGRSPGGGNGNSLQYSCLGNPMDRGAWWATVLGVTKSWTWLSTAATESSLVWLRRCDPHDYPEWLGLFLATHTSILLRSYPFSDSWRPRAD